MKFVKLMFTDKGVDYQYKINEINITSNWNPSAKSGKDFGGFNYASEDSIIRWVHRGDTIYDVEVPKDAENVKIEGATTIYRTNKIIVRNPRKMNDELATYYYKISNIPEKAYYKALGAVSIMNYKNTALKILKDKVSKTNIDLVLEEWNNFMDHGGKKNRINSNETVTLINDLLLNIKNN